MKDKIEINDYLNAIIRFEKTIKDNYNQLNEKMENGYIIKLKDYQILKEKINKYQENKNNNQNNEFKIEKIENIKFNNKEELINLINNNNEFIIITKELSDILCKESKGDNSYFYIIQKDCLKLVLKNHMISFFHNDNILDQISYMVYNEEKYKNLSKQIKEYYNFENNIIMNLESDSSNGLKDIGYLVDKTWVDEWKNYTLYDDIKNNFLINNIRENSNIDYEIIKEILKNNIKRNIKEQSILKLLNFDTIKDFENYQKDNSIVIINSSFINLINKNELKDENKINFSLSKRKITTFINNIPIEFYARDNIIFSFLESNIMILIKIYYFQKELNKNVKMQNLQINNNIGMIQKKWMENFKKKYEYEILSKFLEDNNNIIFSYNSFSLYDNTIDKIIKILPKDYYNKIFKNEQLNDLNYGIQDKFTLKIGKAYYIQKINIYIRPKNDHNCKNKNKIFTNLKIYK